MIHLAVHGEDAQWSHDVARLEGRGDDLAACVHPGLVVPQFAFAIATARDLELVVFLVLAPGHREPLLVKLLQRADVAAAGNGFGPEIQLRQRAPAHRAQAVPVEPDVFLGGARVLHDEAAGGVEFAPDAVAVIEVEIARHAAQRRRASHLGEIPFAVFVAGRFGPLDLLPTPRLARVAMRALEGPLAHVGRLELAVEVVALLPALAHPDAFAQPAKRGDARLGLGHVALRIGPAFVGEDPANGAPLQVRLVVRAEHPERHAVGEVDGGRAFLVAVAREEPRHRLAFLEEFVQPGLGLVLGVVVRLVEPERGTGQIGDHVAQRQLGGRGLGGLHRGEDADLTHGGIDDGFERLADVGRVLDAKAAGDRRIRNRRDMPVRPEPRRGAIRRAPGFAPNAIQQRAHFRGSSAAPCNSS